MKCKHCKGEIEYRGNRWLVKGTADRICNKSPDYNHEPVAAPAVEPQKHWIKESMSPENMLEFAAGYLAGEAGSTRPEMPPKLICKHCGLELRKSIKFGVNGLYYSGPMSMAYCYIRHEPEVAASVQQEPLSAVVEKIRAIISANRSGCNEEIAEVLAKLSIPTAPRTQGRGEISPKKKTLLNVTVWLLLNCTENSRFSIGPPRSSPPSLKPQKRRNR